MLKRVGNTFILILLTADLACTLLAFQLARVLRETPAFGVRLDEPLYSSFLLYLTVAIIWAVTFLVLQVYSPERALRYIDDVQVIIVATHGLTDNFTFYAKAHFIAWAVFGVAVTTGMYLLQGQVTPVEEAPPRQV